MRAKVKTVRFAREKLVQEILRNARALGIQSGAAEVIAEKTATEVEKWAKRRTMITDADYNRVVAKEIKKYNADLSYVYQNRGKII